MDGVLVDASQSYRAASVATVRGYLRDVLGQPEPPVTNAWIRALKHVGGFNNDWDLTSALVRGLLAEGPDFSLDQFTQSLREVGGGMEAVDHVCGALTGTYAEDQLGPAGPLKRYFQEHYLGPALFNKEYDGERRFYLGPAYIDRELPLVEPGFLSSLPWPCAIATGRPRMEADYALERFDWTGHFGAVVTRDCVIEAGQAQKPAPWCVEEAARQMDNAALEECVYVGDQPDDMIAARAAGCRAIGCATRCDHDLLISAGADVVIETVNDLLSVV